ncbi:hypothetical protein BBP40_007914 [Aspergillus hancockii]|nr:hypothetical protein BBP40_007914 [Aspergillus hancockii]
MAGHEWTDEEQAIALYFAVIGTRQCDIVKILEQRMFYRTLSGVEGKIAELRVENNLGETSRRLSKDGVYQFIDRLSVPGIDSLLEPTLEDQEIVNQANIRCQETENDAPTSDIIHPIHHLTRHTFIHEYRPGCSVVAAWRKAAIYLCHQKPGIVGIESREIGRLALDGNRACWVSNFMVEIQTFQDITVYLSKPV